jgi:hypothetical protein
MVLRLADWVPGQGEVPFSGSPLFWLLCFHLSQLEGAPPRNPFGESLGPFLCIGTQAVITCLSPSAKAGL